MKGVLFMKRRLLFILSLFLICSLFTFGETFPEKAKTVNDFIPKGWKSILTAKGDLNKDKLEDVAVVIEKDDKANIVKNEHLGSEYLNLNPRMLLILFRQKDGNYTLAGKNDKGFIKSEGDKESPALMDTLDEISIKDNILKIKFNYFLSAGSWAVTQNIYTFRFQNKKFELIGFDNNSYMRNSGNQEEFSINFSTNKVKITTGGNMFDEKANKPKEEWKAIKAKKKYVLDEMTSDIVDEIAKYVY